MSDEILDHFDDFDEEVQVITIKQFNLESETWIYSTRLKQLGIPYYISNANTINALPLGGGMIGLHIRARDQEQVVELIREIEANQQYSTEATSFHNADLEDIEFEQALNKSKQPYHWPRIIVLVLAGLLLIRAILRALGVVNTWWDFL